MAGELIDLLEKLQQNRQIGLRQVGNKQCANQLFLTLRP
jgi:hypothetical protein